MSFPGKDSELSLGAMLCFNNSRAFNSVDLPELLVPQNTAIGEMEKLQPSPSNSRTFSNSSDVIIFREI